PAALHIALAVDDDRLDSVTLGGIRRRPIEIGLGRPGQPFGAELDELEAAVVAGRPADEESDTGHRLPSCEEVLDPAPEAHLDLRVALELALLERAVDPADEELDVSLLERLQSSHGLAALALLEDDFAHAERQVLGFDARRREDRGPRLRKVRSKILAIGAVLVLHDVPLRRDEQDIEIAQTDAGVAEEVADQSVE